MAQQADRQDVSFAGRGQCLHYYFYFMDEQLGLCYVRVPTWLPCRLQIYFNGHNWLAGQLRKQGIEYRLIDNAFVEIADWPAPSGSPTDGQPSASTESWMSSRAGTVRFIVTSRVATTGARTSASTPPISFTANSQTYRPSTRT